MRITVFGATGPAGRLVLQRSLGEGHDVTAYARTPGKLDGLTRRDGLTVIGGELDDAASVLTAVTGADAVISLLGPGRDRASIGPLVPGMQCIVDMMAQAQVRRLVATSTPSATEPTDGRDLRIRAMVTGIRLGLPLAYRTIVTMAEIARTPSLDWTLVRLPLLHDKPTDNPARPRRIGEPGGLRLSRSALADFLVDEAREGKWNGSAPLLADR